jgi:hypothetical protein
LTKKPTLRLVPARVRIQRDVFERSAFLALRVADLHRRIQDACDNARAFLLRRA